MNILRLPARTSANKADFDCFFQSRHTVVTSDDAAADVEIKVEEDFKSEPEVLDQLNGIDGEREYVRCLSVYKPDTSELQTRLLLEDIRWQVTPARTDENVHFLSLSFARKLLSGALATASPTDLIEKFTSATMDDLQDRFTRFVRKLQRSQSNLDSARGVLDVSTPWPAGDSEVLSHFQQRLADELAKIPDINIPETCLMSPSGQFDSPFACLITYPCQGSVNPTDEYLIPYINTMKSVGASSASLRKKLKQLHGGKVLDAFNDYLHEVFDRVKFPVIVAQGELWHD
ncbi:uncharacterized protein RHO25_004972 [Cercospora beticola]|uniref:Uncharacterized protein n=1 Tax=Cercospora beticola TaxID=122368 RepID=A0ABZ0NLE0_CERBT|nr:hypothetical protein RHO25_004972 [Cercospora beticola]CAK1361443.1 unnamed protein product [Cercospora beticola]